MAKRPQKRQAYRRGADTKWKVWMPMLIQGAMLLLACSGLYYGLTQQQAVQSAIFEERTMNMKDKMDSLQRNFEGIQRYLVDLHNQEERRK